MSEPTRDDRFYPLLNAMFGDWNVAAALLEADPSAIEARSGIGETALHYVAIENELKAVKWLIERGADVDTCDDSHCTPLSAAAELGHSKMCRLLLENGADIFARNQYGNTPLIAASQSGHLETCQLLLESGADIFALNELEESAISVLCGFRKEPFNSALLDLLLQYKGDADINLFFNDFDADRVLTHRSHLVVQFWSDLGLRRRRDEFGEPFSKESEDKAD